MYTIPFLDRQERSMISYRYQPLLRLVGSMRPALVGGGALGLFFLPLPGSLAKLKLYVVPVWMLLDTFPMEQRAAWPELHFIPDFYRAEALPTNS